MEDLETANLRVGELAGRSPGEYFVFSQETKEIVSNTVPRSFELAVQLRLLSHRKPDLISSVLDLSVRFGLKITRRHRRDELHLISETVPAAMSGLAPTEGPSLLPEPRQIEVQASQQARASFTD